MRIHIATDHAGLEFSTDLQHHLAEQGHEVIDHGPTNYDPLDDYPSFCINAAKAVVRDQQAGVEALGVVFGGSGNGEQMAANKVAGVRAALCYNEELARLAREHNNALVLSIGARMNSADEAKAMVRTFLATEYSADPRHQRRIDMLSAYERTGALPPLPGSVD